MYRTTDSQPQPIPKNHETRWHRVIGRVQRSRHVETTRTTGAAGTYVGFACGLTYSVAELSDGHRTDRACGRCAKAVAAR